MKKTFVRLGVLAAALVLIFAACAQPTDESSSGPNAPTIIRLHLDKQETVNFEGAVFEIRVGEDLYVPVTAFANYPYGNVPGQNDGKTTAQQINDVDINDRTRVLAIPPRATNADLALDHSVLQTAGKKNFLASGVLQAMAGVSVAGGGVIAGAGLIQTDNKDKIQRYIDIELVDVKQPSTGYGSVYSGSISGYVELAVTTGTLATHGVEADHVYLYTKDKHGFNDFLRLATTADQAAGAAANIGDPIYGTRNANIKKVSLKPGINDLYLSFFSFNRNNQ
ncbi:MAG: hypothetical protein LBK62_10280 [Treponema sp.]|jgi:hypothetical protein|nr:hypothetical protein [Treponema sp.]